MAASLTTAALLMHSVSAMVVTTLEADILAADGNKTTLRTQLAPKWSTTSPVRSTANILWTSIVTLLLCMFTVIHVNIPPPNERRRKYYRRKVLWAVAAMLAPEYALWIACEQWNAANRLKRDLQAVVQETNQTKRFGLTYCFYAAMGGFVVDVSPIHETFTYTTIMPAGLVWLAEHGHFIELPESAIQDRSKADVLAKTLVCIQVAWLIIQSTGRAANGLPIALLEVHVLAHVACALLLYIIWFKKPLGIKEATRVDSSKFNDEIALMLVLSLGGAENERRLANRQIVDGPNTSENPEPPVIDRSPSRIEPETRDSGEHLDGVSSITPKDTERWSRANRAEGRGWPPYPQRLYVSKRAKDAEALGFFLDGRLEELQRSLGQHLLVMGLIVFLTAAYAAIHLTAWGYHFPTKTEMWLWRGSSLTIASIAPVFLTLFLITTQVEWPDRFQDLKSFLYGMMEILLFLIYFSARLFLLIAAFISVREMPIGVFITMQWSDYIPHL